MRPLLDLDLQDLDQQDLSQEAELLAHLIQNFTF